MFPDGILRPALLQFPIIKYGPPPTFTPPPLPTSIPTPTPDLRDMVIFPVLVIALIGFIIFLIACAVVGFVWLSKRGKDKK